MSKSIARKLIALIACALIIFSAAIIIVINSTNNKSAEDYAKNLLGVFLSQMYDGNYVTAEQYKLLVELSGNAKNIRVSIIDLQGNVLADTLSDSPETFENHLNRPEIINANSGDLGKNIRKSETFNVDYLYLAKKITIDQTTVFLRISVPINSINSYLIPIFVTMFIIFVIILILIFLLSKTLSKQILNPIDLINKKLQTVGIKNSDSPIMFTKYDEINGILLQIENLSNKLDNAIQSQEYEKNKLKFILESINQGIVAVDKNKNAILINQVAADILDCELPLPTNMINIIRNQTINDALSKTLEKEQYQSFDICLKDNRLFEFRMLPTENEDIKGIIIILEVTDARKLHLEKQEFFQNASHELNTPLTSILGYSELLVKEQKYNAQFLEAINKEASRMRLLILDMLRIAELENKAEIIDEVIDLKNLVLETTTAFTLVTNQKNITIECNLETGNIKANRGKIREVVSNLLDNAIKYTAAGGKITLTLKKVKGKLILAVKDNGIGIPRQYLNRVFERFFRVDKGRSKSEGGTGLGLAIVKHICNYYNAPISITSQVGVGTEISISFEMI